MFTLRRTAVVAVTLIATCAPDIGAAQSLSINRAAAIAVAANDPEVAQFKARARALEQRALADRTLPDPQLRLGLANFPTDTFAFDQEPMTQLQVGIRQAFPRGRSREHASKVRGAQADVQRAGAGLAQLQIVLDTRQAWLTLWDAQQTRDLLAMIRSDLVDLVTAGERGVAAGAWRTQDVLRTELELSLLDDRLLEAHRAVDTARVDLARLVGAEPAAWPLPAGPTGLPEPPSATMLRARLAQHPVMVVEAQRVEAGRRGVDLAREQLRPGVAVDLGYGARGGGRADFASAMLMLELPLRARHRQDREIEAARADTAAAEFQREARLLELERVLARALASRERLNERRELFETVVLERARASSEAARTGYENRVNDYAELIRAQLAELDAQLQRVRLATELARTRATLLFLAADAAAEVDR